MRPLFALVVLFLCGPALAQSPHVTVSGVGEVAVAPDIARITLGVTAEADQAAAAMQAMSADLTAVLDRLDAAGIAAADMQTSGLSLQPVQDYNNPSGRPRITGYMAASDIAITVRNLEDLGAILDQVVSDGANQLNGLQFDVADRAPHLTAARQAAVADAVAKATTLADAAGVTLGAITAITEGGQAAPMPFAAEMRMASDGVPMAAGQITISADVTLTYAID